MTLRRGARAYLEELRHDLRYAARMLRRSPGFATVAILTLGLGAGANTAVFSVVDAVLLRPLPYPRADRLVTVWGTHRERGRYGTSLQDYEDWRARNHVFQDLGIHVTRGANLTGDPEPRRILYTMVSPSLLRVLGVPPLMGRWFTDDENLPGHDRVALLSHGLWQQRYGGDPAIVGKTIRFDGTPLTVVGVMPAGFAFPSRSVALWKPFGMRPDDAGSRGGRWVSALGRLKDGVSVAQARAEMVSIMAALEQEYPETNRRFTAEVEPLLVTTVGSVRPALMLLVGAVVLVLLIACANVASLLLARAASRERGEMAIRAALGASRARLVRQLLAESLLLAGCGSAAGLLLAWWIVGVLVRLAGGSLPRAEQVSLDGRVVAFALGLTFVVAVFVGLVPAVRGAAVDLTRRLNGGAGRASSGHRRLRRLLVVTEVALAVVVLVGAGLLFRSLARVLAADIGFEPHGLLVARVEPAWRGSPAGLPASELVARVDADRARAWTFYEELTRRIAAHRGVRAVAAVNAGPLSGSAWNTELSIDGRTYADSSERPSAQYRVITPGYFSTMGIPLRRGRRLTEADRRGTRPVAVVSDTFARANFGERDAIGRRVSLDGSTWFEIVGVVGDVPDVSLEAPRAPTVYVTFAQAQWGFFGAWGMDLYVRTDGDPLALAGIVGDEVRALEPALPVSNIRDVREFVDLTLAGRRFNTLLLGTFAAAALALSVVGLYGLLAFSVSRRTRELGIRAALGASRGAVLRLVVGEGAALAAGGLVLGAAGALALSRLIESQLFEITPADPATFAGVGALVGAVAFVASYLPARRAARIDPAAALRAE